MKLAHLLEAIEKASTLPGTIENWHPDMVGAPDFSRQELFVLQLIFLLSHPFSSLYFLQTSSILSNFILFPVIYYLLSYCVLGLTLTSMKVPVHKALSFKFHPFGTATRPLRFTIRSQT